MRKLVTGTQMKAIDGNAIHGIGIPSLVLMERAAEAAVRGTEQAIREKREKGGLLTSGPAESGTRLFSGKPGLLPGKSVLIFSGTGNNGADAVAMGRMWKIGGADVRIILVGNPDHRTDELTLQLRVADNLAIPAEVFTPDFSPENVPDLVVDGLFCVGLSRAVTGDFALAVGKINALGEKGAFVTAVDIPSGIDSATGQILGTAVRADATVTFGFEKLGTFLYPGRTMAGKVTVADIGFPSFEEIPGNACYAAGPEEEALLPPRKPDSHKGTYGKVLIVAGSAGMCGAAYFSALAAYRTGAGLVRILTVPSNVPILQQLLPEALISTYEVEEAEEAPEEFREKIEKECAFADVIVLGPGLGKGRHVETIVEDIFLSAYVPILVDADGLNSIAEYPHLADFFTENVIITPHLMEMSRLTGIDIDDIKADPVKTARNFADEKGIICVLKDAITVIARHDGKTVLSDSGSPAMAKGGSGDVLTGVIAALIAMGVPLDDAATLGVYLHGRAGTRAGEDMGVNSVLAREIADRLLR